jgi:hypothetical protein
MYLDEEEESGLDSSHFVVLTLLQEVEQLEWKVQGVGCNYMYSQRVVVASVAHGKEGACLDLSRPSKVVVLVFVQVEPKASVAYRCFGVLAGTEKRATRKTEST